MCSFGSVELYIYFYADAFYIFNMWFSTKLMVNNHSKKPFFKTHLISILLKGSLMMPFALSVQKIKYLLRPEKNGLTQMRDRYSCLTVSVMDTP